MMSIFSRCVAMGICTLLRLGNLSSLPLRRTRQMWSSFSFADISCLSVATSRSNPTGATAAQGPAFGPST